MFPSEFRKLTVSPSVLSSAGTCAVLTYSINSLCL
nr:MAG TPA: hypothetical protein [Bacteriophage sp.]